MLFKTKKIIFRQSESNLHRSNQPPRCQEHIVQILARSNGQLIEKHDLKVVGWRTGMSKINLFLFSSLLCLVENSQHLSYVLMSFKKILMSNSIFLSRPSCIYAVVLFLTKSKSTTNRITIPFFFLIEMETK